MRHQGHKGLHRLAGVVSLLLVAGLVTFAGGAAFAASSVTVTIGTSLSPKDVTVAPGTTVTWQASDDGEHRVRSTSGPAKLDSGDLDQGQSWSFTFATAGTYTYVDDRHKDNPALSGTVTVGAASGPGAAAPGAGTAPPGAPAPAAPTTAAVSLAGKAFAPASITVAVGGTVTWTNNDSMPHNVTSNDGAFTSPTLATGGTFTFTFPTAGTFGYNCTFHGGMTGTVIVQPADGAAPPPASAPGPVAPAPGAPAPAPAPGAPAPAPGAPAPAPGAPAPASTTAAVSLVNAAFAPASVTIAVGGTVTWTNNDKMPHNVTSNDNAFTASPTLSPGQVFTHTFTTAGTFAYNCTFHGGMTGTVIVQPADGAAPPPAPAAPGGPPAAAPNPPTMPAMPGMPAAPGQPGKHTVTISDAGFTPATLEARAGDTVTWVNNGAMPHTATAAGGAFDVVVAPGASGSTVLQAPGTIAYVCTYHSYMTGSIVVSAALPGVVVTPTPPAASAKAPVAPAAPATPAAPGQPSKHTVTISDTGFTPATLEARAGDTVTWVNNGKMPHTATTAGGAFDVIVAPGASGSTVLQTPGTINYVCTYHSYMTGSIVVSAALPGVLVGPTPPRAAPKAPVAPATPSTPAAPGKPGQPSKHTVTISDTGFSPANLTARAGDTVTWVNKGAMPHTATAAGAFDVVVAAGASGSAVLQKAGTIKYVCTYHSYMTGSIVVSPALPGVVVGPAGQAKATPKAPAAMPAMAGMAAAPSQPGQPGQPSKHTVTMSDTGFTPANLTARAGDTVTWVNNGKMPHTATAAGGAFDVIVAPGASGSTVLQTPGTIKYVCTYHVYMTGSIVVSAALAGVAVPPPSASTSASGASSATGTSKPVAAAPKASSAKTKTYEIKVNEMTFAPAMQDARVGDTISWVNVGKIPHTVTAKDGSFDKSIAPGERYNLVLRKEGNVSYVCTYHPGMDGQLMVGPALAGVATPPESSGTSATAAPTAPVKNGEATTYEIQVKDSSFNPALLEARVGDTISWVNLGKIPHTVTAKDRSFDKRLAPGERFNLVLRREGTIEYVCTPHPSMFGTLIVRPALADAESVVGSPVASLSPIAVSGLSTGWLLILGLLTSAQLRSRITASASKARRQRRPAGSPS